LKHVQAVTRLAGIDFKIKKGDLRCICEMSPPADAVQVGTEVTAAWTAAHPTNCRSGIPSRSPESINPKGEYTMKLHTASFCAASLAMTCSIHAATITVGPGGSGSGYDHALIADAVSASLSGDTIKIDAGTYYETIDTAGKAIELVAPGGLGSVIVDGGGAQPLVICTSGEGSATTFRDLVLQNGAHNNGGAIRIGGSSPSFVGCLIQDNHATDNGGGAWLDASNTIFEHCRFLNNHAGGQGGGVYAYGSAPVFLDCQFEQSTAGGGAGPGGPADGGGACMESCQALFERCLFGDNSAASMGGGLAGNYTAIALHECTFKANQADHGGGMGLEKGTVHSASSSFVDNQAATNGGGFWIGDQADGTLVHNHFRSNHANFGGALHAYVCSGMLQIDNCDFEYNNANDRGGALYMQRHDRAAIVKSRFKKNRAMFGGALGSESSSTIQVGDCAFDSNAADDAGGGIWLTDGRCWVGRSIFENNQARYNGGAAGAAGGDIFLWRSKVDRNRVKGFGGGLYAVDSSLLMANHCEIIRNRAGVNGGGLFADNGSTIRLRSTHVVANWSSGSSTGALGVHSLANASLFFSTFQANAPTHVDGAWTDLGGNVFIP
jgi:hypothetical protein